MSLSDINAPVSAVSSGDRLRGLAADAGLIFTFAAVLGLFAISPVLLDNLGYAYQSSGGGALTKVHPSTLLAFAALALRCLARRHPLATAASVFLRDGGVVVLILAVAIAAVDAAFVTRIPVTGLIDTFVLPAACFLLLRDLNVTCTRWLARAVILILVLNAIMAFVEFTEHTHFIQDQQAIGATSDPTLATGVFDWRAELAKDWRPTALLGHPLINGLVVGSLIICLVAPATAWLGPQVRVGLLMLEGTSMFTFGARTALILTVVLSAGVALRSAMEGRRRGQSLPPRTLAWAFALFGLILIGGLLAAQGGLLDRTIDRFLNDDGSASTRLTMLSLFEPFSWSQLILAPDKDVLATWQRLEGLEFGIESSWVGLALDFGLAVTAMIIVGLAAFSRSVMKAASRGSGAVLLGFFISVSGFASLSGKTTTFAMIVTLIMLLLPKRQQQPRFSSGN